MLKVSCCVSAAPQFSVSQLEASAALRKAVLSEENRISYPWNDTVEQNMKNVFKLFLTLRVQPYNLYCLL